MCMVYKNPTSKNFLIHFTHPSKPLLYLNRFMCAYCVQAWFLCNAINHIATSTSVITNSLTSFPYYLIHC